MSHENVLYSKNCNSEYDFSVDYNFCNFDVIREIYDRKILYLVPV